MKEVRTATASSTIAALLGGRPLIGNSVGETPLQQAMGRMHWLLHGGKVPGGCLRLSCSSRCHRIPPWFNLCEQLLRPYGNDPRGVAPKSTGRRCISRMYSTTARRVPLQAGRSKSPPTLRPNHAAESLANNDTPCHCRTLSTPTYLRDIATRVKKGPPRGRSLLGASGCPLSVDRFSAAPCEG